ncbi:unnamed protein product [Vitrella brassicaformis CCMP3155]|uniref:Uncharacterized protein n=1 Tax=Vitrella brassicaformis (strain CCMP3155) TaxID=1169540 RepID=A0A0G4H134_VITBC|nr:unnamed protein product [Vitrella brassicaformis CCMP3155]|eukprot:CEM37265.1 unnamed protein product [Vitrella brassicaformis CCMP3155]
MSHQAWLDDARGFQVANNLRCCLFLSSCQPPWIHVWRDATNVDSMDTKRRIDMAKAFADLYLMLDTIRIWGAADVLCLWRRPHKVVKSLSIDFSRYKVAAIRRSHPQGP